MEASISSWPNPPFVRMELIKDEKPALKRRFPKIFAGRADLYVYFYGLAIDILRDNGCLAFISSNTYLNAKFGIGLREHFLKHSTISTLIDFAETHVFDAVVEPAIIVLQKTKGQDASVCCVKWQEDQPLDEDSPEVVIHKAQKVPQKLFLWRTMAVSSRRGIEDFCGSEWRDQVIRTCRGRNSLWSKNSAVERRISSLMMQNAGSFCEDERSCEIIKPFIRGRDIGRWAVRPTEAWLIYTYHGVDIKRYPLIEEHLRPHKKALEARATEQGMV